MKRVVMGIVDTPLQADQAVRRLAESGISPRDVSVLYPDRHGDHDFGFEANTKAPEGALMGIGFGAMLGATLGLALSLAGLFPSLRAVGELGPLLAALAGAAVGGFVVGVAGAMLGATVPEIEAKYYEGKSTIGSILVAVHIRSANDADVVRAVLDSVIATDIVTTSEAALPQARA
ncbi:MAG: DUF3341 domain-containing protein [Labilithrix sp.]|nr:DUF3341 domain-containing protein [Labilithrix sp.]MCW5814198.1 DUF3341 domain-containing protein [Labilithrix sp.]